MGSGEYDAAARRDRYYDGPTMAERDYKLHRAVSTGCLRLMIERDSTAITFDELAEACPVSVRTLRRRYPCIAAAAYAATWWLPPAGAALNIALAPPERSGPCWPTDTDDPEVIAADYIAPDDDGYFEWPPAEFFQSRGIPDPLNPGHEPSGPRSVRDVLSALFSLDVRYAREQGFLAWSNPPAQLRDSDPELSAWHDRAVARRSKELANAMAPAFGLSGAAASLLGRAAATAEDELLDAGTNTREDWTGLRDCYLDGFSTTLVTVTTRIAERTMDTGTRRTVMRIRP